MQDIEITETPPRRRKKWKIFFIIFFYAFSVFAAFAAISSQSIYKPVTDENTTEYTGTIRQISVLGFFTIYTHEQDFPLYFVIPEVVIDEAALQALSVGDVITFRIRDLGPNTLMNGVGIHVVALMADGKEIINFESVNNYFEETRQGAWVGFGIMGGLFFLAGSLLLWHYVKAKKREAATRLDTGVLL